MRTDPNRRYAGFGVATIVATALVALLAPDTRAGDEEVNCYPATARVGQGWDSVAAASDAPLSTGQINETGRALTELARDQQDPEYSVYIRMLHGNVVEVGFGACPEPAGE